MYNKLSKLTVIIPTYNRKTSIKKVINFCKNIPQLKIIILDGSNKPFNKALRSNLAKNMKYLYFKGSSLCERVFLSRKYIKTKYTIISCDDEFYNPDGLLDCINYLDKNSNTICCMGDLVLGFRKRKLGTVFFQMYPFFSKKFKFKSKKKINKVLEFLSSNTNRPTMYSVIRTNHFKKISLFCGLIDNFKCMDIYELIFDIYLSYNGNVKSIKSFYWFRNKINDVITKREMSFAEFWRSKNNIKLKEELLYQIMNLLNNNKIKNQLELLFNLYTKKNNRKLKTIRDNFILKFKNVIPKNIYEPIQKVNQNEMLFDQMVNSLNKKNYKISLKTLKIMENFTK